MEIILASQSPRRQELLCLLDIPFKIVVSKINEDMNRPKEPRLIPYELSYQKAKDVFQTHSNDLILAADTIVFIDDKVLEKPQNEQHSYQMLKLLSGRKHSVITSVCILSKNQTSRFSVETIVEFYELSDEEIWDYIATKEPIDKAGSYGIQGKGSYFVKAIEGDYFNIVGLPIAQVARELKKHLSRF